MSASKSIWYNEVLKNSWRLGIIIQGKDESRTWPVPSSFILEMMSTDPAYFDSQYAFEEEGNYFLLVNKP